MTSYTAYIAIADRYCLMNVRSFLKRKGFHIITPPDELYSISNPGPVHLLVFDTDTFFSNGTAILDLCKRHNNLTDFPLVFVSDNYELSKPASDETVTESIHKPFRLYEIEFILQGLSAGSDTKSSG